jgi:hypothetical protein
VIDTAITEIGNNRWLVDNGQVGITVDANRGGSMVSAILRSVGKEMMWRDIEEPSESLFNDDDASFFDSYVGGMQELFPNAGPATTVLGAPLPFHGEACRIPWNASVEGQTLRLSVGLRRYPFSLERRFSLRPGEAAVDISSAVTNRSSRELPIHWGLHPVFAEDVTSAPAVVFGGFRNPVADTSVFGAAQSVEPGEPMVMESWNGRQVLRLFDANAETSDLGYAAVDAGWYVVHSMLTGSTVGMTWPTDVFSDLWIWQECRSPASYPWWGRHHLVGIEPHSSSPSRTLLDEASEGSARIVQGGETVSVNYSLSFAQLADSELLAFVETTAGEASTPQRRQERQGDG